MNYLLRDLDPQTWREFKSRAVLEGRSLRAVLLTLVTAYARGIAVPAEDATEPQPTATSNQ